MKRGDSLFRYKRAYAPQSIKEFRVTFHETHPGAAAGLVVNRKRDEPGWLPTADFVPAYRAPSRTEKGDS